MVATLLQTNQRFGEAYLALLDTVPAVKWWWLDDEPVWTARILCVSKQTHVVFLEGIFLFSFAVFFFFFFFFIFKRRKFSAGAITFKNKFRRSNCRSRNASIYARPPPPPPPHTLTHHRHHHPPPQPPTTTTTTHQHLIVTHHQHHECTNSIWLNLLL
jgi:hypothetical protein